MFVLGKLSMRSTAQKVSEAAVSTSRRVRESARTHSQERALRQEMRRAEQVRMDLDAAGTEEVERPELRNERVTGPARHPAKEPLMTPLARGEEEIEEGEIYEAPRKTLPRVELFARRQKQDEEEPAIEIDHNDPTAGAADEEDIVPVEIVPVIQPVRVQEEAPAAPMAPEAPAAEALRSRT